MHKFIKKLITTPILVISLITLLITIPATLYYFTIGSGGGMGLAGLINLFVAIITIIVLFIEQIIFRFFKMKIYIIWIIEILIILVLVIIYLNNEKKLTYMVDENIDWFAVIQVHEKFTHPEYSLFSNVKYEVGHNNIIFTKFDNYDKFNRIYVSWGGYRLSGEEVNIGDTIYSFFLYYNPRIAAEDFHTDSIIQIVGDEIKKNRLKNLSIKNMKNETN